MRGGFCRPRTGGEGASQRADLGGYALEGMELMGLQLEGSCGAGLSHFRDTEMHTNETAMYLIMPDLCAKVSICVMRPDGRLYFEHHHGTASPATWQVGCRRDTAGLG